MTGERTAESDEGVPRPWLVALKEKAERGERPRAKAVGRWLGDYLRDPKIPNGLLKTELAQLAQNRGCGIGRSMP